MEKCVNLVFLNNLFFTGLHYYRGRRGSLLSLLFNFTFRPRNQCSDIMTAMEVLRVGRGALFACLCVCSSTLGTIYVLIPFLLLILFRPRIWRLCADRLIGFWMTLPIFLLEFVYRIKVVFTKLFSFLGLNFRLFPFLELGNKDIVSII